MEGGLFLLYSFFYLVFKALFGDNDYPFEKDARTFSEGMSLLRQRQYVLALAYFNDRTAQYPRSALAWLCRARCHLALDNPYGALADSSKAANLDYNLPDVFLIRGRAFFEIKEFQEAYLQFDKAVWHARQSAEAFRWRGLAQVRLGQREKGLLDLRKAISLGDEDANFFLQQQPSSVNRWGE